MRTIILNFHGIGVPARQLEPDEDRYWVSQDFFDETLDLCAKRRASVEISITFDDGNASDIEIGAEGLERHGMTGTFFPLSDRIGEPGSLSAEDMRMLVSRGHRIGSHGAAHVDWTALDEAGRSREWCEARDRIAEAAGTEIDEAAIPFGRYNGAVVRGLRSKGYTAIYSSDGGAIRPGDMPIPRTSPRNDMDIATIADILAGREPLKRSLRRAVAKAIKRRF